MTEYRNEFDEEQQKLRTETIQRMAEALDIPEQVMPSMQVELFEGDRGERTVYFNDLSLFVQFGAIVADYQAEHPDTLVATHAEFSRSRGTGWVRVNWWPRGEAQG